MKINSFTATKVHGYLNYDIQFFSELTFLIGINGSGKTSALKLILGLISPSYQYLNAIEYESAELICSSNENERDIKLTATQNKVSKTFSIGLEMPNFDEKPQAFPRFLRNIDMNLESEEISIKERSLKEQFDSTIITRAIRQLATPKFLGLDRKIYEGRNIDLQMKRNRMYTFQKYRRRASSNVGAFSAIDSSLEDVQFLIYEYFRKMAQQQPKISEEFKRKIFELAFKYNDDVNFSSDIIEIDALIDKKNKVLDAIKSLDLDFLDISASLFFGKVEDLIKTKKLL
jgi:energy-coupling factor transporter ATP-binding protein EcfA2